MVVKVAINGAGGRMGRRLMALASADPDLELVQAIEFSGHPMQGKPVGLIEPEVKGHGAEVVLCDHLKAGADVVVDFSIPQAAIKIAQEAKKLNTALVVGTTAKDFAWKEEMKNYSAYVPMIHAGNFSLGVNLILKVAADIAKALGENFDIEVVEGHHNKKVDAPSGTAMAIAESLCAATDRDVEKDLIYGREGQVGARTKSEIGVHALRMGAEIGLHTVYYASDFERIELTHRAGTRDVFAGGALRAAKWLAAQTPGYYSMHDVLFGKQQ